MFPSARRILLVLILGFSCPAGANAQTEEQKEPAAQEQPVTLEALFAKARQSVGAAEAVARLQNIVVKAQCQGPNGEYQTELVSWRTPRLEFTQGNQQENRRQTTSVEGDYAWVVLNQGPPVPAEPFMVFVARMHEYQKLVIDFDKLFKNYTLVGDESFADRPCVRVDAVHPVGGKVRLYFEKDPGRLAGYVIPQPQEGGVDIANIFLEWQTIEGVQVPTKVRATDAAGEWTLNFQSVQFNQAEDKPLVVPPAIKAATDVRKLHNQQRTAHLNYDAEMLVGLMADNCVQIKDGEVVTQSRSENLARFKEYFASFQFEVWEDVTPPVVTASRDGAMVTVIAHKRVRGFLKEDPEKKPDETIFAWLEVWKQTDGRWQITTIATTEQKAKS